MVAPERLSANSYMAKQIHNRIAEQRRAKGWSQQQLADAVGVHWITISKLERGVTRLHLDWLERLSDALGVPQSELIPRPHQIRNITISGKVHFGGELEAFDDDEQPLFELNIDAFYNPENFFLRVEGNALYPYFKHHDILGCRWIRESELYDDNDDLDYSRYYGRFCVVQDSEENQWLGILSAGSSRTTVSLHNANFPPLENIVAYALAQVVTAFWSLPPDPKPKGAAGDSD